jgi:hypothetical protein
MGKNIKARVYIINTIKRGAKNTMTTRYATGEQTAF